MKWNKNQHFLMVQLVKSEILLVGQILALTGRPWAWLQKTLFFSMLIPLRELLPILCPSILTFTIESGVNLF